MGRTVLPLLLTGVNPAYRSGSNITRWCRCGWRRQCGGRGGATSMTLMVLKAFFQIFDRLCQFNDLLAANSKLFVLLSQSVFHLVSQDTQSTFLESSRKERRGELPSTTKTSAGRHLEYNVMDRKQVRSEWTSSRAGFSYSFIVV